MQLAVCSLPRLQINFMLDYVTEKPLVLFPRTGDELENNLSGGVTLPLPLIAPFKVNSASQALRSSPRLLPIAEGQLLMFLSIYSN